jgi:hypothetical protein
MARAEGSPHRPQPFVQVLVGPAHSGGGEAGSGDHTYARVDGGIEIALKSRFEIPAIQVDWFRTQFANAKNDRQNNLLVAAGITYHWSLAKSLPSDGDDRFWAVYLFRRIAGKVKQHSSSGNYGNWELSADSANAARRLLVQNDVRPDQMTQVRGFCRPAFAQGRQPARSREVNLLITKSDDGVDASGAASRDVAGRKRDDDEQRCA